ncbi:histidine kinase [Streptomyces sp. NPDC002643]
MAPLPPRSSTPPGRHPVLGLLLRARNRLRATDLRRPWLFDTAVVLVVAALNLPILLSGRGPGPAGHPTHTTDLSLGVQLCFVAAFVVPLWWRRRAPAATFFALAAVAFTQWTLGVWMQEGVSLVVAPYSLALRGSLRVLGWAAVLTVVELSLAVFWLIPVDGPVTVFILPTGNAIAAIALGLAFRVRRLYMAALEDRAGRLEIERDQRVRLTAATERSRVAREMHDIVGHNLSVMVGLADRDDESTAALRLIGDTGRQAMGELRRVLGVLRETPEEAELNPQPGVAELDALLGRVRAAGLAVTYRTTGDPRTLGDGVRLTVYRIVQEALTNTLKHAGAGARAEVTVTIRGGHVRVCVADDGTARRERPERPDDSGHGRVGIRRRTAMYHGTVTIGPRDPGDGWIVDVLLEAPNAQAPPTEAPPADTRHTESPPPAGPPTGTAPAPTSREQHDDHRAHRRRPAPPAARLQHAAEGHPGHDLRR